MFTKKQTFLETFSSSRFNKTFQNVYVVFLHCRLLYLYTNDLSVFHLATPSWDCGHGNLLRSETVAAFFEIIPLTLAYQIIMQDRMQDDNFLSYLAQCPFLWIFVQKLFFIQKAVNLSSKSLLALTKQVSTCFEDFMNIS